MNWVQPLAKLHPIENTIFEMLIAIATSFRAELFDTQYLL
jgi:hypothetical protein